MFGRKPILVFCLLLITVSVLIILAAQKVHKPKVPDVSKPILQIENLSITDRQEAINILLASGNIRGVYKTLGAKSDTLSPNFAYFPKNKIIAYIKNIDAGSEVHLYYQETKKDKLIYAHKNIPSGIESNLITLSDVAFSTDGKSLAITTNNSLYFYSLSTGSLNKVYTLKYDNSRGELGLFRFSTPIFSPDNTKILFSIIYYEGSGWILYDLVPQKALKLPYQLYGEGETVLGWIGNKLLVNKNYESDQSIDLFLVNPKTLEEKYLTTILGSQFIPNMVLVENNAYISAENTPTLYKLNMDNNSQSFWSPVDISGTKNLYLLGKYNYKEKDYLITTDNNNGSSPTYFFLDPSLPNSLIELSLDQGLYQGTPFVIPSDFPKNIVEREIPIPDQDAKYRYRLGIPDGWNLDTGYATIVLLKKGEYSIYIEQTFPFICDLNIDTGFVLSRPLVYYKDITTEWEKFKIGYEINNTNQKQTFYFCVMQNDSKWYHSSKIGSIRIVAPINYGQSDLDSAINIVSGVLVTELK